jgi:hypothetical protein
MNILSGNSPDSELTTGPHLVVSSATVRDENSIALG